MGTSSPAVIALSRTLHPYPESEVKWFELIIDFCIFLIKVLNFYMVGNAVVILLSSILKITVTQYFFLQTSH